MAKSQNRPITKFLWLGSSANPGNLDTSGKKTVRTEGLWVKCENCRQIIWKKDLEENLNVCPKCEKHFRIDARTRLALLLDENQYETLRRQSLVDRSAEVCGFEALLVASAAGAARHRTERCGDQRAGQAAGTARGRQRDGVCVHRRQHGRGGGRDDHAGGGARC